MEKQYEAPELTLVGEAGDVVMGSAGSGFDLPHKAPLDSEFEED